MNKRFLLLTAFILICRHLFAQAPDNILKNNSYCSISAKDQLMTLRATSDSLIITYKKGEAVSGQDRFQINSLETRGGYTLAYVKMDPLSMFLIKPSGITPVKQPLFGVFTFHFEKEDGKVLVLHDGRLWLTPEEAKRTYALLRVQAEYFNTWYLASRFDKFIQYPNFNDADEATVEKIAVFWIKKVMEHRDKKIYTVNTDRTGADYGRDNLTKVLVNNHLSPMATPLDFSNKLKQFNLKLTPTSELPQKPATIIQQ